MSFVSALHDALDQSSRSDVAAAVHELVGNALHRLDPDAEIKRTDYFTHTFVPDLIIRWGPVDARSERHVHLRFSVLSEAFAEDLDLLGDDSPLFLGMTDQRDLDSPEWLDREPSLHDTLVTQGQAIDEFESHVAKEIRTRRAATVILRSGRGLVDETRADRLGTQYTRALVAMADVVAGPTCARAQVQAAIGLLNPHLAEGSQREFELELQTEWIRSGGDPEAFPGSRDWEPAELDDDSLRDVLIGMLNSAHRVTPETWLRNAGFIKVEDLGRLIGPTIQDSTPFNDMAHALLPGWSAKRVWSHGESNPYLTRGYEWLVENNVVGLRANGLRTFFADDGRHFTGKPSGRPLPELAEARELLSEPGIVQLGLRGVMGGIEYRPAGRGDVFAQVHEILGSQDVYGYRVESLITEVPHSEAVAKVDFDRRVIDLADDSAPVADLARLSARCFSKEPRLNRLDHFMATGESPGVPET